MTAQEKKKKIEIDEDFFNMIIQSNKKLADRIEKLEGKINTKINTPVPVITPSDEKGYAFQCMETSFFEKKPETPQDMVVHQQKVGEFRKKLETLMKEYKVGMVNALFLKKL